MAAFYFFVALIGALYYGFKWATDKGKSEYAEKRLEERLNSIDRYESRYGATFERQRAIEDKVLSGEYYNEICSAYEEDFKFVYGYNWKNRLLIPPVGVSQSSKVIKLPTPDYEWVCHLMLADEGKMNSSVISPVVGFPCGGLDNIDTNIKFVQCVERRLIKKGITDIRFVVEPPRAFDYKPLTKPYSKRDMCGGRFIIEALAKKEYTDRIW